MLWKLIITIVFHHYMYYTDTIKYDLFKNLCYMFQLKMVEIKLKHVK